MIPVLTASILWGGELFFLIIVLLLAGVGLTEYFRAALPDEHIGERVLRDLGPLFSRLRAYLMVNQVLTPNEDLVTGETDRFNPVALYGLPIPIGPRATGR